MSETLLEFINRLEQDRAEANRQLGIANILSNLTPDQAVTWVENNVTNLATAKDLLILMVRVLIVVLHRSNLFTE